MLRESLLPHAQLVTKQVSVQWVMDARRVSVGKGARPEDIIQPVDGVEPGSKVNVVPPLTEPNVVPSKTEHPLSSLVEPAADAAGQPQ